MLDRLSSSSWQAKSHPLRNRETKEDAQKVLIHACQYILTCGWVRLLPIWATGKQASARDMGITLQDMDVSSWWESQWCTQVVSCDFSRTILSHTFYPMTWEWGEFTPAGMCCGISQTLRSAVVEKFWWCTAMPSLMITEEIIFFCIISVFTEECSAYFSWNCSRTVP